MSFCKANCGTSDPAHTSTARGFQGFRVEGSGLESVGLRPKSSHQYSGYQGGVDG